MQNELQIGKTKWIFIHTPEKETIDKLAQEYGIDEMIVEDILDFNVQSKIDTSSNLFFIALTFTKYIVEESRYISNELDVIIGENVIITTTMLESEKLNAVFEEMKKETNTVDDLYKSSPYYILYRIIDSFYDKTMKSLAISSQRLLDIQTNMHTK